MLVFSAHVANPTPGCCPSRKAIDGVESFLVRPAEIVNQRLPKVIAVRERHTRNSRHANVNGFDLGTKSRIASATFEFVAEFRLQQSINLFCLSPAAAFSVYRHGSFLQEPNALIACPRLHPFESAINQTHGCQAVESWIQPASEREIRRALIGQGGVAFAAKDLADRSPLPAAEFRIVMPAVNVLRHEVADHGAHEHVGRKMLMSAHTRKTDQGRQAIRHCFCEWAGVFVRDDSCYRPCRCSVLGRKRRAAALNK